ncbi:hypothetical protein NYE69_27150 [Paenibacillus sp. FSL R5-0527]|uniref:hypothetical protein n=1 Tax=Paenibacillus TaxID=44249 RepID=UPI00097BA3D3|nr:hypothetical protein [Paenibacillus macerans]MEC0328705.1 hypothetical protein [Paenibacillus macerans]OMG47251.1 hypothetical protein BK140_22335 [Paenibacillus macerans]
MKYTFSQMRKRYTNQQLSDALDVWITNHQLRIKLVLMLSKDGNRYKGHQLQYKGMEMIITGEAQAL